MSSEDVLNAILVLAPGFVALKVFQLFGTQRKRSEWEWTIWSLITGVALAVIVAATRLDFGLRIPELEIAGDDAVSFAGLPERLALAVVTGIVLTIAWRGMSSSRISWLVRSTRQLTNSAWDHVLDTASQNRYGVEIAVPVGEGSEALFLGAIGAFAREADEAQPWLYIQCVRQWDPQRAAYLPLARTDGVLVHREQITRLRITRNSLPVECGYPDSQAVPAADVSRRAAAAPGAADQRKVHT